ncbi:MAG TPA: hypothetical protein VF257_07320 [Solirubrobacteraceae bacterium]
MLQPRNLKRSFAMGLAVCAIAPASAAAAPAIDVQGAAVPPPQGQSVAAGGGPGVTARDIAPQNLTAPDQIDRVAQAQPRTSLRGVGVVNRSAPAAQSDEGGVDAGVLIGLGGGAFLLLVGGLGLATRKRVQTASPHQLA